MKKKQIRTVVIAAVVLVFLGLGLARLNIEPADSAGTPQQETEPSPTAGTGPVEEPADASGPSDGKAASPSGTPEEPVSPGESAPSEQPTETPEQPAPAEAPGETPEEPETHTCTLEIRCDTVADTSKLENEAVIPYIPSDGVILETTEAAFTPGESVFEVLKRVTRDKGIQMEFREDGLYSGAYIEGIHYLYEFDGGSLSGWMYKVNGQFPNYGCSQYTVEDGDEIVWMYTCDLGRDVGDNSTW